MCAAATDRSRLRRRERAWESGGVDVGVDSFAAVVTDPDTGAVVESAEECPGECIFIEAE